MRHKLKVDPLAFDELAAGRKSFEIRKDDRGFAVGDILMLQQTVNTGDEMAKGKPLVYTGELECVVVTHIIRGPSYGVAEGWAVMSICRSV